MIVENAKLSDKEMLISSWIEIFQDSREYTVSFFERRFKPNLCYIIRSGEKIASGAFLIPTTILYNDKTSEEGYNIVGVFTYPEFRHKGYMSALFDKIKEDHNKPLVLYPEEYIRHGYEKEGFKNSLLGYQINLEKKLLNCLSFNKNVIKKLYDQVIEQFGALERKEEEWEDIFSSNIIICDGKSYAIYEETGEFCHEAFINDISFLNSLSGCVIALPTPTICSYENSNIQPFGMGYNLKKGIFIPEQY